MKDQASDGQVCGFVDWKDGHEALFIGNRRRHGPDEGSAMQDVETGTFLVDWDAFDRAGKSRAKLFIGVAHELNSLADCEGNSRECVQAARQIREGRKVCFAKPANGIGQQGGSEGSQRDGSLAEGFL